MIREAPVPHWLATDGLLAPFLQAIAEAHQSRDDDIVAAYATGAYSYPQIAEYFGLHFTTIGRIVYAAFAARHVSLAADGNTTNVA